MLAALTVAPAALAQTYDLVSADVGAAVRNDGAVSVAENLTVSFSGSFTYGFREIPYRRGEQIVGISVLESGRPLMPGASTPEP